MDVILLIFIYFTLIFIVATLIKNNSIVDIGWGIGFVIVAWYVLLTNSSQTLSLILITLLISIWGLRLFYHIIKRNLGKSEDFRYATWRKEWGKWLIPRAFFQIFMLQGIIMYIISLPVIYVSNAGNKVNVILLILGISIWIIGFYFEAIGDYQLKVFKSDSSNKGQIMKTGLWKYTRHPNYFGEATMWFGIYFIAMSGNASPSSIVSPLTITFLLVFVSGVPMLEKSMKNKDGYEDYARITSVFIPWFPKKTIS